MRKVRKGGVTLEKEREKAIRSNEKFIQKGVSQEKKEDLDQKFEFFKKDKVG